MAIKRGLARGLDALLPENDMPAGVTEIAVSQLDPNPDQPRRTFDAQSLQALSDSIRQAGVLQPLLVVENGARYRIVAGERRYRAARMAGLQSVPCVVRDLSEQERMEAALIENLQREDLNPMDEAAGIRSLMDECGYTQELAAKRVGRSRSAVANLLCLLQLPESIQEMVKAGELSAGHARVLAGMDDAQRQLMLAQRVVREGMSVRELEKAAAAVPENAQKPAPRPLPAELSDMQERLQNVLGVRTALKGNLKKGKIILQYQTADELEAIYEIMERLENE